jgi:hypothetical protein
VTFTVTHRTPGHDAYLLVNDADTIWIYYRTAGRLVQVTDPRRLAHRGQWATFDGVPEVIVAEANDLHRRLSIG